MSRSLYQSASATATYIRVDVTLTHRAEHLRSLALIIFHVQNYMTSLCMDHRLMNVTGMHVSEPRPLSVSTTYNTTQLHSLASASMKIVTWQRRQQSMSDGQTDADHSGPSWLTTTTTAHYKYDLLRQLERAGDALADSTWPLGYWLCDKVNVGSATANVIKWWLLGQHWLSSSWLYAVTRQSFQHIDAITATTSSSQLIPRTIKTV